MKMHAEINDFWCPENQDFHDFTFSVFKHTKIRNFWCPEKPGFS